jgi:hypothetical protein
LDFWVRGVVTDSDSIVLLVTSLATGYLFHSTAIAVLVPILGLFYGFVFAVISYMEQKFIPSNLKFVKSLANLVKKINVIPCEVETDAPPLTLRRNRPAKNYVDFVWYNQNRLFREFTHYYEAVTGVLEIMLSAPVKYVLILRVVGLIVPIGKMIRYMMTSSILYAVLPAIPAEVDTHAEWFAHSSGNEFSDRLLMTGMSQVAEGIQHSLGFMGNVDIQWGGLLPAVMTLATTLLPIPLGIYGFFKFVYSYQTWKFNKKWLEGGLREEVMSHFAPEEKEK